MVDSSLCLHNSSFSRSERFPRTGNQNETTCRAVGHQPGSLINRENLNLGKFHFHMKDLFSLALLVLIGCSKESKQPSIPKPEPIGNYEISGRILLNGSPVQGAAVSYNYQWGSYWRESKEIKILTDKDGSFHLSRLPSIGGALKWNCERGDLTLSGSKGIKPPVTGELAFSITATAKIKGLVTYKQPPMMPRPAKIKIHRIGPVPNASSGAEADASDNLSKTLACMASAVLNEAGEFIIQDLPAGTYQIEAPPTEITRGFPPLLFPSQEIALSESEEKELRIAPSTK